MEDAMENPIDLPDLGDLFWIHVFQYLDLRNQIFLTLVNKYFKDLFSSPILIRRFEHIDASILSMLNENEIHQLLDIVGSRVISYTGSMVPNDDSEQYMWLLRLKCPKLRKLKLLFKRNICQTLNDFNNIKELHIRLHFGSITRKELLHLKKMNLKRLTVEAAWYPGTDLCHLDSLESLEIGYYPGFDANYLEECCTTMKDLRHLNIGYYINLSSRHFTTIRKNCVLLERLAFGIRNLNENVHYEIVCRLPKLKHLLVWINGFLRNKFLIGLIEKVNTPQPLLSLVLVGSQLPQQEFKLICEITSLLELDVACDAKDIQYLSKLCNLEYLHITTPEITDIQLLKLIQSLPNLTVLNVGFCPLITEAFVSDVQQWLSLDGQARRNKIKIYVQESQINFNQLNDTNLLKINNGFLDGPIYFKSEL